MSTPITGPNPDARPLLILIVEDSPDVARMVHDAITQYGAQPTVVPTGSEALIRLADSAYHILLTDYSLPDMTGATLIAQIQDRPHCPAIILMSGYPRHTFMDALPSRVRITYLEKPFSIAALYAALATCQRALLPGKPHRWEAS